MNGKAMTLITLGTIILLAMSVGLRSNTAPAEQASAQDSPLTDQTFQGKIVLVRIDRSSALETKQFSRSIKNAAVEEIITLGMPKHRVRITSVAIKVPVDPPRPMAPSSGFPAGARRSSRSFATN